MMSSVTIPFHLALPALLSLIFLLIIYFKRGKLLKPEKKKRRKSRSFIKRFWRENKVWFWRSSIIFLLVYLYVVSDATYRDIQHQLEIKKYDLDGDGFFSEEEMTREERESFHLKTFDFKRNLAFVTGIFYAFVASLPFFIIGIILQKLFFATKYSDHKEVKLDKSY